MARPLPVATVLAAPKAAKVSERSTGLPSPDTFTRFERARILGARALQVSLGAPILTDVPATLIDPVQIAEVEFAAGVIPITVRRGPRTT